MTDLIWGFRVLENDEDGDPLEHGVVQAPTFEAAKAAVQEHLTELGLESSDDDSRQHLVRFYPLQPQPGVWSAHAIYAPRTITLTVEPRDDTDD